MTYTQLLAKDLESRVVELEAKKQCSNATVLVMGKKLDELKKFKEEYDVSMDKHEKNIKKRDVFTKKSAVIQFKAFEEYKEAIEGTTFSYFVEGFEL